MPDGGTPNFEQTPKLPERALETPETGAAFEAPAPGAEQPAVAPSTPQVPGTKVPGTSDAARKDPTVRDVESILEEDLGDTYAKMNPALQAKFRKEGERVTGKIVAMMRGAKLKAREVLALISGWLKMIPGVNKFFLIQEAKIKTDKLVVMAEAEKQKRGVL